MSIAQTGDRTPCVPITAPYRRLPFKELFRLIAEEKDVAARSELYENRYIDQAEDGRKTGPAEYLYSLYDRYQTAFGPHAEPAYDLTVEKFWNYPEGGEGQSKRNRKGTDCSHYFRACLKTLSQTLAKHPGINEAIAETLAAETLRKCMARHFFLSVRESFRESRRFVSRYYWKFNGYVLCLLFPTTVRGRARRAWLEANAPDTDPSRRGERQRIQDLIDRYFGRPGFVTVECAERELAAASVCMARREVSALDVPHRRDLAEVVAEEKASIADRLRPAIRCLGKSQIRQLVLRIFTAIDLGDYSAEQIARDFGITKAALSRFAGTLWSKNNNDGHDMRVPDLWVNLSGILARDETFRELARSAGVWERAARITKARVFKGRTRRGAP